MALRLLLLEKEITLGDAGLTLSLEAANLLDAGTVLARELDLGTGRAALADDTLAARLPAPGANVLEVVG